MLRPNNSLELLNTIEVENLYDDLINQLNKDFQLVHLPISFEKNTLPVTLKNSLEVILMDLITNNYDNYLNLLYRIDVSEKELSKITGNNLTETVEQITLLILKREYQKVWFKNKI